MYSEFKLTQADGTVFFCRKWIPEAETKALLVLVHGKGENTGRYLSFCDFLMDNSVAVYAFDLRGHGLTDGKVGHTGPREAVLDDIDMLIDTALSENPGKPVFLYGHSMGGHLVLDYRRLRGERIKAYVISSPWLWLKKPLPAPAVKLVCGLAKVLPLLTVPTGINVEAISSIEAEQKRYADDKSMNSVITAATFRDITLATEEIFKDAPQNRKPFLLVHGDDDLLVNVEGSRLLAKTSPQDIIEYVEYAGNRHEILNDVSADELKTKVVEYINSNL